MNMATRITAAIMPAPVTYFFFIRLTMHNILCIMYKLFGIYPKRPDLKNKMTVFNLD
jgi:hypothetical protein